MTLLYYSASIGCASLRYEANSGVSNRGNLNLCYDPGIRKC